MRLVKKYSLIKQLYKDSISYLAPSNLSYWWNFGILALVALLIQLVTGIALAMHYTPNTDLAFISVEHIMRDINYGWLLRYVHANGASFFFFVVYMHVFRGLYYGSYAYPRQMLWAIGVIILLIMILTAFLGYVLPWGQMSFWAATVITKLASAVPIVGTYIVEWLWGGFSVDNPTLNRFFSLHYLLPFVIVGLVGVHLILLHQHGSNNPLGSNTRVDNVPFHPYYTTKDIVGIIISLIGFFSFVFFAPNVLGHSDNYIPANPLVTPAHIVPEWYFLPFYAILRSIPHKLTGVIMLLAAILILLLLPLLVKPIIRSNDFRPSVRYFFFYFVVICLVLGWIGGQPVEEPYYTIGRVATVLYFLSFILILPVLNRIEYHLIFNHK